MPPIQAKSPYSWEDVLNLVRTNFAYMEPRINPPSSMHKMTVEMVADHADKNEIWVIEQDQTPIACVFLTPKERALYVGKLAVNVAHRGKGLARVLMDKAAEGLQSGFKTLELQTRIELTENHATFSKMGFVKTAEGRHTGFDRTTEITMQKDLS